MKKIESQRGQALILIAFGIVALIGFTALAVDGGRVFSDRRNAQNAADTSALASALEYIYESDKNSAKSMGMDRALSNGYQNDADSSVTVVFCDEVDGTADECELPPGADPEEYIRVEIISDVPMTFARVLGREFVTNRVEAIARAQINSSSPLYGGAAMVALRPDGTGFSGSGNGLLTVHNSGIFSNSTDNCSMRFNGNVDFHVDTAYTTAGSGTICRTGGVDLDGPETSGPQIPYPPSQYNVPPPDIQCAGAGSVDTTNKIIKTGTHNSLNLSGNYTFEPGNHCFNGTVKFTGGNINAHDVNFRINSGGFDIGGNSSFTCSNMMVHGVGGSGMKFNGNGDNTCTSVTFYMASGGVTFNGNVANNFTAPTSGPYKGLLIYLPYGNSSDVLINGTSDSSFTGSIIGISSPIEVHGNSFNNGLHTMIIGYEIDYTGNANTTIVFDASEQYIPPADPTIEFTK